MKKVTNPQSIKANKLPNIKDVNPVGVIYTTTTSVNDRLNADAVADLVVVISAGESSENGIGVSGDRRILRTKADNLWKTLDC